METETMLTEIAGDDGTITRTTETDTDSETTVEINIRDDDIQLFETESGRQFFRKEDMEPDTYIEPVPTPDGFNAQVIESPNVSFVETEAAIPTEPPTVEANRVIKRRMD